MDPDEDIYSDADLEFDYLESSSEIYLDEDQDESTYRWPPKKMRRPFQRNDYLSRLICGSRRREDDSSRYEYPQAPPWSRPSFYGSAVVRTWSPNKQWRREDFQEDEPLTGWQRWFLGKLRLRLPDGNIFMLMSIRTDEDIALADKLTRR